MLTRRFPETAVRAGGADSLTGTVVLGLAGPPRLARQLLTPSDRVLLPVLRRGRAGVPSADLLALLLQGGLYRTRPGSAGRARQDPLPAACAPRSDVEPAAAAAQCATCGGRLGGATKRPAAVDPIAVAAPPRGGRQGPGRRHPPRCAAGPPRRAPRAAGRAPGPVARRGARGADLAGASPHPVRDRAGGTATRPARRARTQHPVARRRAQRRAAPTDTRRLLPASGGRAEQAEEEPSEICRYRPSTCRCSARATGGCSGRADPAGSAECGASGSGGPVRHPALSRPLGPTCRG